MSGGSGDLGSEWAEGLPNAGRPFPWRTTCWERGGWVCSSHTFEGYKSIQVRGGLGILKGCSSRVSAGQFSRLRPLPSFPPASPHSDVAGARRDEVGLCLKRAAVFSFLQEVAHSQVSSPPQPLAPLPLVLLAGSVWISQPELSL